jgi:cytosine/adenosine deaminase-related metal-dependent hydrolase
MPHPKNELLRLMKRYESNDLLTIGCAILGPHYSTLDVAIHDFAMAKDLGIVASMHQGGGPARTPEGWQVLESQGLLGPQINIVHGHALSDEQLKRFCDLGMSFSATAENEMTQGHGHPLTGRLRALGKAPSLGVDLESVCSGEMFIQARIALGIQRSLDNYAYRELHGNIPPTSTITTKEALSWVTIEGAKMLGQDDRIGSLAVGKQADLVMIRATDINMQPVNDLVSAVVMQTSLANIENVMIAGSWQKRHGELLAQNVLQKTQDLNQSATKIKQALGL